MVHWISQGSEGLWSHCCTRATSLGLSRRCSGDICSCLINPNPPHDEIIPFSICIDCHPCHTALYLFISLFVFRFTLWVFKGTECIQHMAMIRISGFGDGYNQMQPWVGHNHPFLIFFLNKWKCASQTLFWGILTWNRLVSLKLQDVMWMSTFLWRVQSVIRFSNVGRGA